MMNSYNKREFEIIISTWVIAKLIGFVIWVIIKNNSNNIDRDAANDW